MLRVLIGAAIIGGSMLAAGGGGSGMSLTAAPAGGANTSSIALSGDPAFNGTAAFAVTLTSLPNNAIPTASVQCFQNGSSVYGQAQTQNGPIQPWTSFALWSQTWANAGGGAAACTADLYYFTYKGKTVTGVVELAQTSFSAS